MQDDFIAKGQPKSAKPDAGKAPTIPMPVYGIVKDNHDDTRQGGIRVYIPDGTGKDPNVKENWSKLIFPLGFYGRTVGDAPKTGYGTYKTNPASYGEWHSPPDIGTKVVCIFINGDPNFGYYLGGVYDPDALHMVPAIGGTKSVLMNEAEAAGYGGAVVLPVVNLNDNSEEASAPSKYIDAAKPVHSYAASILNQQGLIRDPIRGVISSSSQREAASRVGWGVSTPGRPIYQGGFDDDSIASQLQSGADPSSFKVVARRGGHSIVMDDGDLIGRSQLVRIRTALGHQITMSDDGQTLFIIHSNGQSYIELGKEGTVDIYSTNSFNVRTQGDINLHADNNINIHAEKNLNIRAEEIHVQAEGSYKLKVLKDYNEAIGGKLTSLVGGAYAVKAGGQASMVAGAEAFVVGTKVNLNSGDPATTPENVDNIKGFAHTDTLFDKEKGFMAAPGKLLSIASRAPAHAPWANAGQGVDVQVDLGASASLPADPGAALSSVNEAAAASAPASSTPAVSSAAVQPGTNAVSGAMDRNTTSAVLGSIAQDASKNPLTAAAAAQGAGIVTAANGAKSAVVGQYASTAENLQSAGTIKPGSAALVNSLVQKGSSLANAVPSTLFTGQQGAQNLTSLATNATAQAKAVTTNMQNAQTALTNAAIITGKESATAIAGVVKSGATVGVEATIAAVKGSAGSIAGSAASAVGGIAGAAGGAAGVASAIKGGLTNAVNSATGAASKAMAAIGSGNLAGQMADGVTSGLGSLKDSLAGLSASKGLSSLKDSAKGVAAGAFNAIKNAFPKMPAGVPVNVEQVAKEAAAAAESASASVGGAVNNLQSSLKNPADALKNAAGSAAAGIKNQLSGGAAALGKQLGAASAVKDNLTSAGQSLTGAASAAQNNLTSAAQNLGSSLKGKGP